MEPGAILTEEFLQAALDLGALHDDVPAMWAEFVDYWIGIPGQRGVKTVPIGWLATWRNRVREVLKRGKPNGQRPRQQSLSDRAHDLAEQARSAERARGLI